VQIKELIAKLSVAPIEIYAPLAAVARKHLMRHRDDRGLNLEVGQGCLRSGPDSLLIHPRLESQA
jgi:hypothetical protein